MRIARPQGNQTTSTTLQPVTISATAPAWMNPSAMYNPNLGTNMRNGMLFGFLGGFGLGAVIVGNIVGFPEVEVGEGVAAGAGGIGVLLDAATAEPAATISLGGLSGGAFGTPIGAAAGYAATKPMSPQ